ncbi:hypothetical protein [Pseudomonas sp. CGJS7]|uniref:hypothetical protein n=1 Tax=Pseudomonas sp. CGJS7 TaxID=3109348 RepID=UPI0030093BBA
MEVTAAAMTDQERAALETLLRPGKSRLRRMGGEWVVATSSTSLLAALLFALAGWLLRKLAGIDVGDYVSLAIVVCALLSALICAVYVFRHDRSRQRIRAQSDQRCRADLAAGQVSEERYALDAIKSLQNPEHGGSIYLLRIDAQRCLAVYDYESHDLAMRAADPLSGAMTPANRALLRRAPASGYVFAIEFSGAPFDKTPQGELAAPPERWPEHGQLCEVPWDRVERWLQVT